MGVNGCNGSPKKNPNPSSVIKTDYYANEFKTDMTEYPKAVVWTLSKHMNHMYTQLFISINNLNGFFIRPTFRTRTLPLLLEHNRKNKNISNWLKQVVSHANPLVRTARPLHNRRWPVICKIHPKCSDISHTFARTDLCIFRFYSIDKRLVFKL